jgi:hypothetical protein
MQMLDRASVRVNLAHQIVVAAARKQRTPRLEIQGSAPWPGQRQPVDATRVLMKPV